MYKGVIQQIDGNEEG